MLAAQLIGNKLPLKMILPKRSMNTRQQEKKKRQRPSTRESYRMESIAESCDAEDEEYVPRASSAG